MNLKAHAQSPTKVAVDPGRVADLSITPGTIVQFSVNLTDAPAIIGFAVFLTYNTSVLDALNTDLTGNVLAETGKSSVTVFDCIDGIGVGCRNQDGPGVISVAQVIFGSQTGIFTSGNLFKVSFSVTAKGFSQIRIYRALLTNGLLDAQGNPVRIPLLTFDGFFSNNECPAGSSLVCEPPTPSFIWSPLTAHPGDVVTFNASLSHGPNARTNITRYFWEWEDPGEFQGGSTELCSTGCISSNPLPLSSIIQHQFTIVCDCFVTLTVTDTDGISWSTTSTVRVLPILHPDFTTSLLPTLPTQIIAGRAFTVTVLLNSTNGFDGVVSLAARVTPSLGNGTVSFASASLNLREGSNSTTLTVSAPKDSEQGNVQVTVLATSGAISHSVSWTVTVFRPQFSVSCDPLGPVSNCSPFILAPGGAVDFPIFLISQYGFNGTVTLSTSSSNGPNILLSQTLVQLEANQTLELTGTISTSQQTSPGFYNLLVSGVSLGYGITYLYAFVEVATSSPFFSDLQLAAPASLSVRAGTNSTFEVGITSLNGFAGRFSVETVKVPFVTNNGVPIASSNSPSTPPFLGIFDLAAGQTLTFPLTVSTIFSTQLGNYTVAVGVNGYTLAHPFSIVFHWVIVKLIILPPPDPPTLVQLHWKHRVSLSIRGLGAGTETFVAGLYNANNSTRLYARIIVTGTDQIGTRTFIASSQVLTILPEQSLTNILVAQSFNQSTIGITYKFTTTISWGVDPLALTQTTPIPGNGVPSSGIFSVVP